MKITNLSFGYEGRLIFDDYSAEFPDGISCLMGDSGIGKTTLLKLIGGLLKPQSGTIESKYKKPAYMFQEDRLLPWLSVEKNLLLVSDNRAEIKRLLDYLEIDPQLPIRELSGGMARRAALARCLVYDGDLLLMDEPFKGMDEGLMERVSELIISQHKTAIISTHSKQEAVFLKAGIVKL